VINKIQIKTSAQKELFKLPDALLKRMDQAIQKLGDNPRPEGSVKLKGFDYYRIRIGSYRLIYQINDKKRILDIIRIRHRNEAYAGLK
jgi:mRNA interferase RelE/StbE